MSVMKDKPLRSKDTECHTWFWSALRTGENSRRQQDKGDTEDRLSTMVHKSLESIGLKGVWIVKKIVNIQHIC